MLAKDRHVPYPSLMSGSEESAPANAVFTGLKAHWHSPVWQCLHCSKRLHAHCSMPRDGVHDLRYQPPYLRGAALWNGDLRLPKRYLARGNTQAVVGKFDPPKFA